VNCLATRFAVWVLTLALFPVPVTTWPRSFAVEVLQSKTVVALPPRSAANVQEQANDLAERVLEHLATAEKNESDPWLRDDIRQSWISVSLVARGEFPTFWDAFIATSYRIYGCHPDQVWPRIVARRQAILAAEYSDFFPAASSPKKPCGRVGRRQQRVA
jgi:hypothetical protein